MIRKLGLGGGLALGGSLILFGVLMISAGSPQDGGGIMIVLGMLFLVVPGVLIIGLTLIAWITTSFYGLLNDKGKRIMRWSLFALVILSVILPFILSFLDFALLHVGEKGDTGGG